MNLIFQNIATTYQPVCTEDMVETIQLKPWCAIFGYGTPLTYSHGFWPSHPFLPILLSASLDFTIMLSIQKRNEEPFFCLEKANELLKVILCPIKVAIGLPITDYTILWCEALGSGLFLSKKLLTWCWHFLFNPPPLWLLLWQTKMATDEATKKKGVWVNGWVNRTLIMGLHCWVPLQFVLTKVVP